jgi:hypothetical protein|tara:strand:- start:800 stop:919 length:120 start_codon:yes stop_codon:yes gene_type:complete
MEEQIAELKQKLYSNEITIAEYDAQLHTIYVNNNAFGSL